jgi:hypothetical protein
VAVDGHGDLPRRAGPGRPGAAWGVDAHGLIGVRLPDEPGGSSTGPRASAMVVRVRT